MQMVTYIHESADMRAFGVRRIYEGEELEPR